ncbi:MAG: hypothetical protein P1U34_06570 [Coxiellaceae bacterium]|nr:hypothetical protein [Coxiellaceae bacterium]
MVINKAALALCLVSFSVSVFANPIQCKTPKVGVHQCQAKGAKASKLYAIANMPYALCAKTLCTLDKKDPSKASCLCPIFQKKDWTALSFSANGYQQAQPKWVQETKTNTVQSNFSLADQAKTPKATNITCKSNQARPWANCFGVRCTVNSHLMATCICPVTQSKAFAISGPGDKSKCNTPSGKVWSATTSNFSGSNTAFIKDTYKKLYPNAPVSH